MKLCQVCNYLLRPHTQWSESPVTRMILLEKSNHTHACLLGAFDVLCQGTTRRDSSCIPDMPASRKDVTCTESLIFIIFLILEYSHIKWLDFSEKQVSDRHNPDTMGIGRNEESCNGYKVSVLQDTKSSGDWLYVMNVLY